MVTNTPPTREEALAIMAWHPKRHKGDFWNCPSRPCRAAAKFLQTSEAPSPPSEVLYNRTLREQ